MQGSGDIEYARREMLRTDPQDFKRLYENAWPDDQSPEIFIIAKDSWVAHNFAHKMQIPKKDWHFVVDDYRLRGRRNIVIIFLANWEIGGHDFQNEKLEDFCKHMASLGLAKIIRIQEW